jgi:hypothetical protein
MPVSWDASDLDAAASETGVVHESVANTDYDDASELRQGYSITTPDAASNLVLYLPLQEQGGSTAYDFSGAGNDGTVTGATQGASGLLGAPVYSFDGTDDHIQLPSGLVSTSGWTLALWLKPETFDSGVAELKGDVDMDLRLSSGGEWDYRNFGGTFQTAAATLDTWQYVICTYDGDRQALWVDGVEEAAATGQGASTKSLTNYIANDESIGYGTFDGQIAHARVYDTGISSTQIQTLDDVVSTPGELITQPQVA